jgi:hypothetical protein
MNTKTKGKLLEIHVNNEVEKSFIKGGEFLVRDQDCSEIFTPEELTED